MFIALQNEWNQPVPVSICGSVCLQNNSFCQSAGGGIKLHLVTAVVATGKNLTDIDLLSYSLVIIYSHWTNIWAMPCKKGV